MLLSTTMIHPKLYKAVVADKKMLNNRDMLLNFKLINPSEIHFKPGQFINLNVAKNTFRSYSICSDPLLLNKVSVVVSIDHDGAGTKFLKSIQLFKQARTII